MRVTLVGPTHPHRASMVHYTHSLANSLARRDGLRVALLSYDRLFPRFLYKGGREISQAPLALDPAVDVRSVLSWGSPASWRKGARWAAGSDVLHLQSWTGVLGPSMASVAARCRKAGARIVVTLHNVQPHEGLHRILSSQTARLLRKADRIVVHSDSLREGALRAHRLHGESVRVIPQGRYTGFDRGLHTKASARKALGIPASAKVALCFGTIRDYKGVDVAIRTLARLPEEHVLLIAGHSWEPWSKYQAVIDAAGLGTRVKLDLRYIPDEDLETYYKAADVSFLPYKNFEGQSAQALTAAAFGLPIVASRLGGLQDAIEPDFLVAPGDEAGFAAAIRRAVAAGRPTVRPGAAPTWDEVASLTQNLYEEVAA